MNSPRGVAVVRLAMYFALIVALAGALHAFMNYYVLRGAVVANVQTLAPANAEKTLEIIEAQLSPSGDGSLARQLLQSQHEHAMLLQQGWLSQAQAQEKQLQGQLVLWVLVSSALLVAALALGWKRDAL